MRNFVGIDQGRASEALFAVIQPSLRQSAVAEDSRARVLIVAQPKTRDQMFRDSRAVAPEQIRLQGRNEGRILVADRVDEPC